MPVTPAPAAPIVVDLLPQSTRRLSTRISWGMVVVGAWAVLIAATGLLMPRGDSAFVVMRVVMGCIGLALVACGIWLLRRLANTPAQLLTVGPEGLRREGSRSYSVAWSDLEAVAVRLTSDPTVGTPMAPPPANRRRTVFLLLAPAGERAIIDDAGLELHTVDLSAPGRPGLTFRYIDPLNAVEPLARRSVVGEGVAAALATMAPTLFAGVISDERQPPSSDAAPPAAPSS